MDKKDQQWTLFTERSFRIEKYACKTTVFRSDMNASHDVKNPQ